MQSVIKTQYIVALTAALFLVGAVAVFAQQPNGGGAPQEAIDACSGMSEGASCSFTGMQGEALEGTCTSDTPDGAFACFPGDMPTQSTGLNNAGGPSSSAGPTAISSGNTNQINELLELITLLQQLLALSSAGIDLGDSFDLSSLFSGIGSAPTSAGPESNGPSSGGPSDGGPGGDGGPILGSYEGGNTETIESLSIPSSEYYGSYSLTDTEYGTEVEVTVSGNSRTIVANSLPNHDTGEFPTDGNPNAMEEVSATYNYEANGTYAGEARSTLDVGVAVNGIMFDPGTGEAVTCESGETYRVEAFQDAYDLGFDFNNAHVQPGGLYHYHGVPTSIVDLYDNGEDLVHVGFAADGHMIYYDTTGTVESSWQVTDELRTGTDCGTRSTEVAIDGTTPDGTYNSDWEYVAGSGNLDACSGAFVDDEYVYFVTDEYPFVPLCLQGN